MREHDRRDRRYKTDRRNRSPLSGEYNMQERYVRDKGEGSEMRDRRDKRYITDRKNRRHLRQEGRVKQER